MSGRRLPSQRPGRRVPLQACPTAGLAFAIIAVAALVLTPLVYLMVAGGSGTVPRYATREPADTTTSAATTTGTTTSTTGGSTSPSTTSEEPLNTTTAGPNTTRTTSTAAATTTATTTTATTTTTEPATTPPSSASCTTCSDDAVLGQCRAEFEACEAAGYSCNVLCYATFQMNGATPTTCTNGFTPEWIPLANCLCDAQRGDCAQLCGANCAGGGPTVAPTTSPASLACQTCFDSQVQQGGPCQTEYQACVSNPSSACALLCAPYYRQNSLVFPSCNDAAVVPEWPPLAACLCPQCGNNVTCPANADQCTQP